MGYYIKETVGDVTVEIGYNTLEELQARLREIDLRYCSREELLMEVNPQYITTPPEAEERKGLYLVYWPGTKVGTAWIHDSLEEALADINLADCGTPELYELGREIPLKKRTIIEDYDLQPSKAVTKWSVE